MANRPQLLLVIDSDTVRRGLVACTLPTDRFTLEFAHGAEEGLSKLAKLEPRALLIGLDEQTVNLCQRVRATHTGENLFVVLTHERFSNPQLSKEAHALGADAALPFPFQLADLEQLLAEERTLSGQFKRPRYRPSSEHVVSDPYADTAQTQALSWDDVRGKIDAIHARLGQLDYYQVLGIERNASAAEIKEAFFACSMEYHPDRFFLVEEEELRGRAYELFKRMSEAFRILTRGESRAAYDQQLAQSSGAQGNRFDDCNAEAIILNDLSMANTPAGRRYVDLAKRAERAGDQRSAQTYLSLAVQCEPSNGAIRSALESLRAPKTD
ncbi:MAG: DnaJ domain-containing protein [Deltaproteobacteria bacterium]|nr:DnaJ domain-containing protein [Deltaproteobacteria bacterium]